MTDGEKEQETRGDEEYKGNKRRKQTYTPKVWELYILWLGQHQV